MHTTALIIGISLALGVGLLGTGVGLDRERSFYPVVTIVVASYYALFALIGASLPSLGPELLGFALFLAAAVIGFRRSLWIVAFALAAHGVFDLTHAAFIANPGVPEWWPSFCLGYDVTAALYLAALLRSGRLRAAA
jgi:hydrogenase/urease accessory protein HupE